MNVNMIATLFMSVNKLKKKKVQISINRYKNKQNVYPFNGILFSNQK